MFTNIKNHQSIKPYLLLVVFLFLHTLSCDGIKVTSYYENAALATSAPLATEIGLSVLEDGGNAFDAAVAVGFALAVVHPEAGNIGGGGFALLRDGATGDITALDFREKAPMGATETMYLNEQGEPVDNLSLRGAKAVGVPGTVAGLYQMWEKYGSKEWVELVNPAAALADTGFIVDQYLANSFADYKTSLNSFPQSNQIFYPNGNSSKVGSQLVQIELARALYLIAAEGPAVFYEGEIADSLVQTMVDYEGLISHDDLKNYQPVWRQPIKIEFDSFSVYSMPPPSSGGIVMGQILKIMESFDLSHYSPNTPDYIHLFSEASKLAFADRSEHLGDPQFYPVDAAHLLNVDYLKQRRSMINPEAALASDEINPGVLVAPLESDQTTHYSICDKNGNIVSLTYTLNTAYGSKLMVNGFGILLNNEMDDFSIKPGVPNTYGLVGSEANKIEPGKRMLSSMAPTIVMKGREPFLVLGSPGGSKIITTVAEAIINICRFNLTVTEAAAQGRFHHQWLPDKLYLEEGAFDINVKQALIGRGHNISERKPYSDLQILLIESEYLITGASDPRNRGTVGGY